MDLAVEAQGDIEVDQHHTVEDVGIVLGQALRQALGDKKGIVRYGTASIPMDETLVSAAVDLSGRPFLVFSVPVARTRVSNFDLDLLQEFFRAFAFNAEITLHVTMHYGHNLHHVTEAVFKAVGRALADATRLESADRRHLALDEGHVVIAIIDYGRGNLGSRREGVPPRRQFRRRSRRIRASVDDAEAVVLPGDGAFHDAMSTSIVSGSSRRCAGRSTAAGRSSGSVSAISCCSRRARSSAKAAGSTSSPAPCAGFRRAGRSPHGMEPRGARRGPQALRRHPVGLSFLLRPFVLSGCSGGREAGLDRGWPETGTWGSGCPIWRFGRAIRGSAHPIDRFRRAIWRFRCSDSGVADRVVRVRCEVRGGDRGRADLRDPVPSREEPAMGSPPARELRGAS